LYNKKNSNPLYVLVPLLLFVTEFGCEKTFEKSPTAEIITPEETDLISGTEIVMNSICFNSNHIFRRGQ